MKRFIAVLLSISIICSFNLLAYASVEIGSTDQEQSILERLDLQEMTQEKVDIVKSDLDILEDVGLAHAIVSVSESIENNELTYQLKIQDVTSYVTVSEDTQGNITFDIHENSIHNMLTKTHDGKLILDGNQVTMNPQKAINSNDLNNTNFAPRARYSNFKTSPYVGSRGDYTKYIKGYYDNNIELGKALKTVALGTLVIILTDAVSGGLGLSVTTQILSFVASQMKSNAERYGPDGDSKGVSYSIMLYEYTGGGISPLDHYYMHQGIYWTQANQKGTATPHEFFEYNSFS